MPTATVLFLLGTEYPLSASSEGQHEAEVQPQDAAGAPAAPVHADCMLIERGRERTGICKCFCLHLHAPAQWKQAGQVLLRLAACPALHPALGPWPRLPSVAGVCPWLSVKGHIQLPGWSAGGRHHGGLLLQDLDDVPQQLSPDRQALIQLSPAQCLLDRMATVSSSSRGDWCRLSKQSPRRKLQAPCDD